ncbi:MAG: tetratricopeptide repeat protein [Thermonemataceae bacterium]
MLRTPEATENPAIAYSLARTYFAIKEYPTAFHKIDTAIAITRELALPTATLYYDRAVMYAKTGRYKKAKKDFFEAITQAPELIAQTDEKGKTIPLLGDATYLLRKYISPQEKDSIQTVGWQERAYNLGLADELSAAQVAIQKAYSLDSLNARTVTIQALIAALDEDYERALVLFEEAEGHPNAQDKELIYYLRAMTWVEMEQYSKALASLDKALVENPKEATYYYEKASIQHTLGQLEEALTLINQALLLTADPTYQLEKAFYLYELDRYAAALNICNALLEKDVMYTEVYYYRALIYQAQEEYEKALQDVAHALRYYPDDEELQALQEELASK